MHPSARLRAPGTGSRRSLPALAILILALPLLPEAGPGEGNPAGALLPASGLAAQLREPTVGPVEAGLLLRRIDGEKRVLMIGAHPDDEDTSLLAALARGMGARTAYLSLSRGEGGQNLIGSELNEGLGLLRTGELLSARALDGAEQLFARTFDFGFSKSAEETFLHWPEEEVLRDVVWAVRTFRPQVILSIFSGTPSDGHGQHQAAGIVAHRAFEVAGDPDRFPDQLAAGAEPWAPAKLYRLVRRNPEAATVHVETGRLDPLLGRSLFQVAMESRSRHSSQDMGVPRTPGPRRAGAELAASRVGPVPSDEDGFFTGVDTALVAIARAADAPDEARLRAGVEGYREALARAREALHALEPDRASPHLADALEHLAAVLPAARAAPADPARTELVHALERRMRDGGEALLAAAAVVADLRVDRPRVIAGEAVGVEVLVWNGGDRTVDVDAVELSLPEGWRLTGGELPGARVEGSPGGGTPAGVRIPPGELRRWGIEVRVPDGTEPSRPYFLREERDGALYRWPDEPALWARPGNPPLLAAALALRVAGSPPFTVERAGHHVGLDRVTGEYRVPVHVVPALSVEVEPGEMAWPREGAGPREVTVRVRNLSGEAETGDLTLEGPDGWEVSPARAAVSVGAGAETAHRFRVRPGPAVPDGTAMLRAVMESGGRAFSESLAMVDYPHVDPLPLLRPSELRVSRFPVRVRPEVRVGYVMGPGDGGMRALEDLGVEVEALDEAALRSGELGGYGTIVLGIRAYETRPDLRAANERLLDFARRGGTVVVQYHRYEYPEGGFAPYPVEIRRPHDRVTDPDAPVTLLEPDHPLLARPNRITEEDFRGWVQERGLYFLGSWDERYTPLLSMADPGEEPARGSLVAARVGEGAYVYTGLALFRQLPRGVPGAYRLLANLVSLRGEDL